MNEYMELAFKEAKKAYKKNEVPVGAVIVYNNKIISKGHNNRQNKRNVLGHAEINAILKAEKRLKDWRLNNCEMYVTLEPCKMCEIIIDEARIDRVYYLISQKNIKNSKIIQTNDCNELNKKYSELLEKFFKKLR